ncbi:hypothetical protein K438DRAFT_1778169 [Mycena galopus ATCC 62051]|nr:hypothetical protein K438DRAFT_1778169 [Mycena galopus ATCC 62051]
MLNACAADRARLVVLEAQISDLERSTTAQMQDLKRSIAVQIQDIKRPLSALQGEQALVQARLDAYKYPVLTLPNEITSEIFIHFIPDYPRPPPLVGIYSPTHLTHICRKWREVAHTTPALWRAIWFRNRDIPYERENHISDAWLQRCGSGLLSIKIQNDKGGVIRPDEISVILAQRARWEHLRLDLFVLSFRAINGPMPLLRCLELELTGVSFPESALASHDVPRLREVVLNGRDATHIALPWAQLTSLSIVGAIPSKYLPILQQAAALVHCRLLDDTGPISEYDYPGFDMTFPCLESLEFKNFNGQRPTIATGFLDAFIVPVLRRLRVKEDCLGPDPIEYLTSFMSKTNCTLAKLHITGERTLPVDAYFLAFPSICEISFEGSYPKDMNAEEDAGGEDDDEQDSDGDGDDSDSDQESDSSDGESGSDSSASHFLGSEQYLGVVIFLERISACGYLIGKELKPNTPQWIEWKA